MLLLIPLNVDVPMERYPWMNWLLIAAMVFAFGWQHTHPEESAQFILGIEEFELGIKQHPLAIIGHMFLHADILHLIGNLLFLWVFGNAVCAKIGQIGHALLFLGTGVITGLIEPYGLGASGAINGIVGAYLVMYPLNDITCFYIFIIRMDTFSLASYWMIVLWFAFDLFGLVSGGEGIAYLSHISGLAVGVVVMAGLLAMKVIEPNEHERSVLDILRERRSSGTKSVARKGDARSLPSSPRRVGAPVEPVQRLHVRLPNNQTKFLPLTEFQRHEAQGKAVNQFMVSEDGEQWMTFGQWRAKRGV